MNEEIDIIELLQRVKEGKAPKEIQVGNFVYSWHTEVEGYFRSVIDNNYISVTSDFDIFDILDTKIKILDKPIIDRCDEIDLQAFKDEEYIKAVIRTNRKKLNEIIDILNKENKDEQEN